MTCPLCNQRVCGHTERDALRIRFHKVILGAGYSETAAQGILAEWFEEYMTNVPEFVKMLEDYERKSETPLR